MQEPTVPTQSEVRQLALAHGRTKKRNNAIVAILSGALPGIILTYYMHPGLARWVIAVIIGLLWGNAFEYAYHRWLLHDPHGSFGRGHLEHHMNVGTAIEPEHVSLGRSPFHIALLFASNGIVVITVDVLLRLKISPGIFVGWTLYLIAAEEIHWRIHLNGWLPPGLRFARGYHMSHHDIPNTHYNVFLPLFDLVFRNTRLPCATPLALIRTFTDQVVYPEKQSASAPQNHCQRT
jgi:hypothetical protein